jgi:hypothetical protein
MNRTAKMDRRLAFMILYLLFLYCKQFIRAPMEPFVAIVAHQIGFSPEETVFAVRCNHRWMDDNGRPGLKHHFILTRNPSFNPVDSADMT